MTTATGQASPKADMKRIRKVIRPKLGHSYSTIRLTRNPPICITIVVKT
jgi:hypothetical protein